MQRCTEIDARAETVRHGAAAVSLTHLRDAAADRQTATKRDIRLDNVHAAFDQILEVIVRYVSFTRGNRNGRDSTEFRIAFAIVLGQRFFEPADP